MSTRSIAVTGMSCDHCASAIRAEISKLPGVTGIDVDVTAGTVRVAGDPYDLALETAASNCRKHGNFCLEIRKIVGGITE